MIGAFLDCLGRFLYAVLVRIATLLIVAAVLWLAVGLFVSHFQH
jgi:hypothetical protein